ncbi:hypothetical protein Tco_0672621 [Tanacetum coccineum]
MAILTIRARRFIQRTGMKLDVNECRAPRNQENRGRENSRRTMIVETPTKNALVAQDRIEGYDWSYQAEEEHLTNFTLMAHTSSVSSSNLDSEFKTRLGYNAASSTAASPTIESFVNSFEMLEDKENNKSRSDKGYHVIPPPYTGNFIPFKPDLTFMDEIIKSENIDVITVITCSNVKKVKLNHESTNVKNNGDAVEPKTVRKNSFRPPVIEDWNSDDDSEVEFIPNVKDKTVRPSTKKIKFVKSAREIVEKVIRPVWNNSSRVNHKNFANKMTHPHPNRRFVPQAVLTRSGKINTAGASVNTAVRPVNTAGSKPTVNHPRPISNAYKKGYSQVTKPFNKYSANKNSIFNKKVNTVRVKDTTARDRAVVSENKGKGANVVKASACWGNPQQKEYREKGVFNSGDSRHMIGNKCYLTEYEDYDGGFVSFGDGKGRILGQAEKKTELEQDETSDKDRKDEQDSRSEVKRLLQQEKKTGHPNITNSINTVSTPVSTAEPSSTNDASSSPVNATKTFEEHLFEQFSPFKNAFTLRDILNVSPMDDNTGIFAGAYDDEDVGGQADLNNLETTMNCNTPHQLHHPYAITTSQPSPL